MVTFTFCFGMIFLRTAVCSILQLRCRGLEEKQLAVPASCVVSVSAEFWVNVSGFYSEVVNMVSCYIQSGIRGAT
ncbi:hypothetical protein M758_5G031400 [Ceratodon purpureus]|uniref:Secreted protein n=1 Tax=Ceratodon purpureus TaxID=3225 RepID=A0A8T0HZM4_CERPU|nr:hypothetical protein KC19_5G029700 [Ceratodon purpureus]KAG0615313.1 hypothetical protein M758_5G031400 [Ceratodon purpureus]